MFAKKFVRICLLAAVVVFIAFVFTSQSTWAEDPYNVQWIRQIGTLYFDGSESMAVDYAGNSYISGYTGGSLGGTNAGYEDAFLTKYDSSGNVT